MDKYTMWLNCSYCVNSSIRVHITPIFFINLMSSLYISYEFAAMSPFDPSRIRSGYRWVKSSQMLGPRPTIRQTNTYQSSEIFSISYDKTPTIRVPCAFNLIGSCWCADIQLWWQWYSREKCSHIVITRQCASNKHDKFQYFQSSSKSLYFVWITHLLANSTQNTQFNANILQTQEILSTTTNQLRVLNLCVHHVNCDVTEWTLRSEWLNGKTRLYWKLRTSRMLSFLFLMTFQRKIVLVFVAQHIHGITWSVLLSDL